MTPAALLDQIAHLRAVAVVRAETADHARQAAEACARGGVRLLEITLTVPGALDVVRALAGRDGVAIGVSPHFDAEVLAVARAEGLLCSMAGLTPTRAARVAAAISRFDGTRAAEGARP